jgi:hypothetical protein
VGVLGAAPPDAAPVATAPAPVPAAAVPSKPAAHAKDRCERCHVPSGWTPARFVHERTSFPLLGKHVGARCGACHGASFDRPVPQSCAGCHADPHAQEFGLQCRACHSEDGFRAPPFAIDAHRRTGFPLVGRHGALPCDECHIEKRERTFTRVTVDCVSCHRGDAQRASASTIQHTRPPFSTTCKGCHEPVAFTPARYPEHDRCFPIASGKHQQVSCRACHGERALAGARPDGDCVGITARCAQCHDHRKDVEDDHHEDVLGYTHQSERCVACHRSAR